MKKHRYHFIILALLVIPSGAFLLSGQGDPFPHQVHINNDLDCESCHKTIKSSASTTMGSDIPPRKICDDCHEEGYGKKTAFPYRQAYRMNHRLHVAEQGVDCKDCHKALYEKKFVTDQHEIVPPMEYCFTCHDNETATQHCMLCHVNQTKPEDHYKSWEKMHGKKAGPSQKECRACHASKDSCARCHRGTKSLKRYHGPNYELAHRYESKITLKNCRACHSDRQCRRCHRLNGVEYRTFPQKRRHPIGWTNRLSSSFHARKARLNLTTCTSCHTKSDCNYCHFWIKK